MKTFLIILVIILFAAIAGTIAGNILLKNIC